MVLRIIALRGDTIVLLLFGGTIVARTEVSTGIVLLFFVHRKLYHNIINNKIKNSHKFPCNYLCLMGFIAFYSIFYVRRLICTFVLNQLFENTATDEGTLLTSFKVLIRTVSRTVSSFPKILSRIRSLRNLRHESLFLGFIVYPWFLLSSFEDYPTPIG